MAALLLSGAVSAGYHEENDSDAALIVGSLSTAQKIDLAKAAAPADSTG
jgi:hypothetical protein